MKSIRSFETNPPEKQTKIKNKMKEVNAEDLEVGKVYCCKDNHMNETASMLKLIKKEGKGWEGTLYFENMSNVFYLTEEGLVIFPIAGSFWEMSEEEIQEYRNINKC